jgi:hypothetical protein
MPLIYACCAFQRNDQHQFLDPFIVEPTKYANHSYQPDQKASTKLLFEAVLDLVDRSFDSISPPTYFVLSTLTPCYLPTCPENIHQNKVLSNFLQIYRTGAFLDSSERCAKNLRESRHLHSEKILALRRKSYEHQISAVFLQRSTFLPTQSIP